MTPQLPLRPSRPPFAIARWGATGLFVLLLSSVSARSESAAGTAVAPNALPAPKSVASPAPAGSRVPGLAAMPDGRIVMSWLEPGGGTRMVLRLASYDGWKWSKPATIAAGDSFFVNWADVPSICPLGGERMAAYWLWRSGQGTYAYDVRVSQSADGGRTWGAPVTPHRDGTATEHGFVSVVPNADGALAVWLDGRKSAGHDESAPGPMPDMTLRAASIAADGKLRDEVEIDGRTCDCCPTAAALTERGMLVAYRDRSPEEVRDIYVTCRDADGWSAPRAVHADGWHIAGCPVSGPALAAQHSHVAIAWHTAAADSPRVHVAFSEDAGRSFGPPIRIDEGSAIGRVGVSMLADGSALVIWMESSGRDALVRARRIPASGPPGTAITVARTSSARASGYPRVLTNGRTTLIAWTEAGPAPQVKLARLDVR